MSSCALTQPAACHVAHARMQACHRCGAGLPPSSMRQYASVRMPAQQAPACLVAKGGGKHGRGAQHDGVSQDVDVDVVLQTMGPASAVHKAGAGKGDPQGRTWERVIGRRTHRGTRVCTVCWADPDATAEVLFIESAPLRMGIQLKRHPTLTATVAAMGKTMAAAALLAIMRESTVVAV